MLKTLIPCLVLISCIGVAFAQEQEEEISQDYNIYIPDMMIRGVEYHGVVVSNLPVQYDTTFRISGGVEFVFDEDIQIQRGSNHGIFSILPVDTSIFTGQITSTINIILPDGSDKTIDVDTYPNTGTVSRLWIVGPGEDGKDGCSENISTSEISSSIQDRIAEGVFEQPKTKKIINTELETTTLYVFITDRYCTPVTAPKGGVEITITSFSPDVTFGGGRTIITDVIEEGFNSAIIDVVVTGEGEIYATGENVSPDSIIMTTEPTGIQVEIGMSPPHVMENSHGMWYVWLERDGVQYIPETPVEVYLVSDNPVLSSFKVMHDATKVRLHEIQPYTTHIVNGYAKGKIYTGQPIDVGDVRILASDRDVTITAHVQGYGTASTSFHIGSPSTTDTEFTVDSKSIRMCMAEEPILPDGMYNDSCNEMWQRLLVTSYFFDFVDSGGEPLDSANDTIKFLNQLIGGDNTEEGEALYKLMSTVNDYSARANVTGGMSEHIKDLLGEYLSVSDIEIIPSQIRADSQMLNRFQNEEPLPNSIVIDSFPTIPGKADVIITAMYEGDGMRFPVYIPDGTITLFSTGALEHENIIKTFGSNIRSEAASTRSSSIIVPVFVKSDGEITASFAGVGSASTGIQDMTSDSGKRLHVSPIAGSGLHDIIAFVSVIDSKGTVTSYDGDISIRGGQGTDNIQYSDRWRGGMMEIRGIVTGVGEIIVLAPGLGGGTAFTTPIRHDVDMDIWYPERVHVSEEFPIIGHTLDVSGNPIQRIQQFSISGDISKNQNNHIILDSSGEVPLIIESDNLFESVIIEGFINKPEININRNFDEIIQFGETVIIDVDTGLINNPNINVDSSSGGLLFSGERERWEAIASSDGSVDIEISVYKPGWEPFNQVLPVDISRVIEVVYEAETEIGGTPPANLKICDQTIIPDTITSIVPGLCEIQLPDSIMFNNIQHKLVELRLNDNIIENNNIYNIKDNSNVFARYAGIVSVEAYASYPDGTEREILYDVYGLGDNVVLNVEPEYEFWGLIWTEPVDITGVPSNAFSHEGIISWEASEDVSIMITYKQNITYLVILGAITLGIPIIVLLRHKIPFRISGVRFK